MKKLIVGISIIFVVILLSISYNNMTNNICIQEERSTNSKATEYLEAIKYRNLKKADENGNIPADGLIRAKEHIDRMVPKTRDAGLWEWDWLGPGNIGGRIKTILPDPNNDNIIWVGSETGGIWKSIDAGATWVPINDFMPSLKVMSLAFDPSSTSIMYAGVNGSGVFKSIDGGINWNQLASTNNDSISKIYLVVPHPHPDSAGIIYVTTFGGYSPIYPSTNNVWKSKDGGTSWEKKLDNFMYEITDLKIDINNSNEILVGGNGNVKLSRDYGETWDEQTGGAIWLRKLPADCKTCKVSFCQSDTNVLYVSMNRNKGEIWQSIDNGISWTLKNTGTEYLGTQGQIFSTIWVCPTNKDSLIVGGLDIYRSMNGGTNLEVISDGDNYHNGSNASSAHVDQTCIVEAANFNTTNNPMVYFGNDGGIQKAFNIWNVTYYSGWQNLANQTLGITQFYGGAASNDGSIIVGGTQDNDQVRYKSSGNWSGTGNWYQAHGGDGGFAAINNNNSNIIYGSYIWLNMKKSIDGGNTYPWSYTGITDIGNSNNHDNALFIAPFSMDPNNPSILVAGGERIWRTTNDASSWYKARDSINELCSSIDIAKGNSNIIWVGYNEGHVALTTNIGTTWTRVDANGIGLPNRFVTDISINPNNSNEVFVTFGGFLNDNVWYTPDAGVTWEKRNGTNYDLLPALPVNTVRFHPIYEDWVYIGTDLGVFATQDKGQTWSALSHYQGSEGPANIEVSELFWQGNDYLIAATYGRGMYRSSKKLTKIYVDGNASSGGNGSQLSPFKTLAEAVAISWPGATIEIESGIYDESQIITLEKAGYIIKTGSGSVTIE